MSRRAEIETGLTAVRGRIDDACRRAGRDPAEVTLVVITKTFPVSDVLLLAELGVTDVGENKHQEAVAKHAECSELNLRWHFVGAIQSNKAAAIASYSDLVHSVDRPKLVRALSAGASAEGRQIGCLIQVSLGLDESGSGRSGVAPDEAVRLAAQVAQARSLVLQGVMGIAPLGADPDQAFDLLGEVAVRVRREHPGATTLSAGMSSDLEAAVERGATHVRVGSAVLGAREVLR